MFLILIRRYCHNNNWNSQLNGYWNVKRHGVNNNKTLCWLTLTLILLSGGIWNESSFGNGCYAFDIDSLKPLTNVWQNKSKKQGVCQMLPLKLDDNCLRSAVCGKRQLYLACTQSVFSSRRSFGKLISIFIKK
uniref:Uncharacterized protein n=1 Tax=Glossina brevipalpis TaxID=37001 RepID=A0A1A9W2V2_9MUSC